MLTALFGIVSVGCQEKQATHVLLYASLFIEATAQKNNHKPQNKYQMVEFQVKSVTYTCHYAMRQVEQ
jgi:hypothetical protein